MAEPQRPTIIGILNVTPDSFYDGGRFISVDAAVEHAGQMLAEGADIIEVGGESTGPGSAEVPPEEELRRTIPVIRAIRSACPSACVSIDTYKSVVAQEVLTEGVIMVNDVTAGRGDPRIFDVLARSQISLVLMFAKDPTSRTTKANVRYDDVVSHVKTFLRERRDTALAAGIPQDRLLLDPGLGHFVSSDARYSFEILARLPEFLDLGCPLLLSPSRKSFLAGQEHLAADSRLSGTIAASTIAVLHGAAYIRTHDVLEVRRGIEIAAAVREIDN